MKIKEGRKKNCDDYKRKKKKTVIKKRRKNKKTIMTNVPTSKNVAKHTSGRFASWLFGPIMHLKK